MSGYGSDDNPYLCCFGQESNNIFLHVITPKEFAKCPSERRKCETRPCCAVDKSEECLIKEFDLDCNIPAQYNRAKQFESKATNTSFEEVKQQSLKKSNCNTYKEACCDHSDKSCCDICCSGVNDGKSFCCYECCKYNENLESYKAVYSDTQSNPYRYSYKASDKKHSFCLRNKDTQQPRKTEPKKKWRLCSFLKFRRSKKKLSSNDSRSSSSKNKVEQPSNQHFIRNHRIEEPTTQLDPPLTTKRANKVERSNRQVPAVLSPCFPCVCHYPYRKMSCTRANYSNVNQLRKNKSGNIKHNRKTVKDQTPSSKQPRHRCCQLLCVSSSTICVQKA